MTVNREIDKLLILALKTASVEDARSALANGAGPDCPVDGTSYLTIAALRGDRKMIDTLLDFHADLNYQEPISKHTVIDVLSAFATTEEQYQMLDYLLELGANPNSLNKNWSTSIDQALRYMNTRSLQVLLKHDAKPVIGTRIVLDEYMRNLSGINR